MSRDLMDADLAKSGLVASDVNARPLEGPERAMTSTPHSTSGYVLPYFHFDGKPNAHYRVKLFDAEVKYKQPKDTASHVYFPKGLPKLLHLPYLIITEGEKKAALAVKRGFPAIGLGGVDSWRNRSVIIPEDAELSKLKQGIRAKLPQNTDLNEDGGPLALGLQDVIDHVIHTDKHIILIYDTDTPNGVKPAVQRAMATLAFELRFKGIPFNRIRQITLPPPSGTTLSKVALDDYLLPENSAPAFQKLVTACLAERSAFPIYPALQEFIGKRMQRIKLTRKEYQATAMAVLSDLDSHGIRLRSSQQAQTYYFDRQTKKLLKAEFNRERDQYDTKFGQFLYRRYGLGAADKNLLVWVAAQFTGEEPIDEVTAHRVIARLSPRDDNVIYQLTDSQYVKVSAKGLSIHHNGEGGILFESDQVEPLDVEKFLQEYNRQLANAGTIIRPFWQNVLSTVRLRDHNRQQAITTLLYYMSPWLYRWRGMQLPVEMTIGEAGSGKSTLYELRLSIINGQPRLRNAPTDLKDWHASISNSGGLHVADNVHLVDRNFRQRLSDEICRIITEPNPTVEMRKYYTNADLVRIPVHAVFALTAIQQPFQNSDIIQRSIITELDKLERDSDGNAVAVQYDAEWKNNQLNAYNGREGWVAHHMLVLHRFFQAVQREWNHNYQAKHRLIHFEQAMCIMARVLGMSTDWLPDYLANSTTKALSESDWTFEGLKTFVQVQAQFYKHIDAQVISDWATTNEEFQKCEVLISGRRLQRYLQQHKSMIASAIGLVEQTSPTGKPHYKIQPPQGV